MLTQTDYNGLVMTTYTNTGSKYLMITQSRQTGLSLQVDTGWVDFARCVSSGNYVVNALLKVGVNRGLWSVVWVVAQTCLMTLGQCSSS